MKSGLEYLYDNQYTIVKLMPITLVGVAEFEVGIARNAKLTLKQKVGLCAMGIVQCSTLKDYIQQL